MRPERLSALFLALAAALWTTPDDASAQNYRRGYGGGGGRAVTAAQAADYGMASLIRSQAQANLTNAQAAAEYEQARTLYLHNRLEMTKTYFENRALNRSYRQQEEARPVSSEAMAHYYEQAKPPKLAPSQLDPVSGQLTWPHMLTGDAYAPYREQLEAAFKLRAQHQEVNFSDVHSSTGGMHDELKKHINELAPQDYETGRKFIDSIEYEAHAPTT